MGVLVRPVLGPQNRIPILKRDLSATAYRVRVGLRALSFISDKQDHTLGRPISSFRVMSRQVYRGRLSPPHPPESVPAKPGSDEGAQKEAKRC